MKATKWTLFSLVRALSDEKTATPLISRYNRLPLVNMVLLLNAFNAQSEAPIVKNDLIVTFSKHTTKSNVRLNINSDIDTVLLKDCIDVGEYGLDLQENTNSIALF